MLRLRAAVRDADPGYFALVMATGIVSEAMQLDGAVVLSGILLAAGIAAYVLLAALYAWRLAAYRCQIRADAADPSRAFGFFTLAAGSGVLAARLAGDGHTVVAAVLLVIGGTSWALLSYGLPLLLAGGSDWRARLWPEPMARGFCGRLPPSPWRSASSRCRHRFPRRWPRWR